ncbi:hypothetical protein VZT92_005783 [Zoarces viviparus]|uniref:Reverse transcriptase n=1 Tax=Zoarces viviparus TaxID=48416 RepID=A0AAW1FM87_ZOAVI
METGVRTAEVFNCDYCPKVFKSARGRSQHKRSVHLEDYEKEKLAAMEQKDRPGTKRLWSRAEVEVLSDFSEVVPTIRECAEIAVALGTGKTQEQVRNKYRLLYNRPSKKRKTKEATNLRKRVVREHLISLEPNPPPVQGVKKTLKKAVKLGSFDEGDPDGASRTYYPKRNECKRSAIEEAANALLGTLSSGKPAEEGKVQAGRRDKRPRTLKASGEKRVKRKWFYDLLRSSRAKLAKFVLDKQLGTCCPVPLKEVADTYERRWGIGEPFLGLGQFKSKGKIRNEAFEPLFTPLEVLMNLRAVANNSATGPDGISKRALAQWDPSGEKLAKMFSSWLVAGMIPTVFKECRTTLLPKTMDPHKLGDINEWRPITIGSMILRLFSRLLTKRLIKACPLHPRQRGFIAAPGCADNLMILEGVIKNGKCSGNTTAVVFIDFAKAFDTVSHEHMLTVLRQKGLDDHIVNLIKNSYEGCSTTVKCIEGTTGNIGMRVGVKQGDPMSPLLFNLAMDPLIQTLETEGQGLGVRGRSITAVAFADDLAILSDSWEGMTLNISILETFCELTGMKVQPKKCHGFLIASRGKSFQINNCPAWDICGSPIHMAGPSESIKYLGIQVSPWKGLFMQDPTLLLQKWIGDIDDTPLDPIDKTALLKDYALTRLAYAANHCMARTTLLARLDGQVRLAVKKWLHLPMCTTDGLIYARTIDGGLGFPRLARTVPAMQVHRLHGLYHSTDDAIRKIAKQTISKESFRRAWQRAGGGMLELPTIESPQKGRPEETQTRVIKRKSPCDWRRDEHWRWANLECQGRGIKHFKGDKISNCWLQYPNLPGFKPGIYSAALQLRANVYPTRELKERGRPTTIESMCRHCQGAPETCSHILGQCPAIKDNRIRRHHKICRLLVEEAESQGWMVEQEKRWTTPKGNTLAPDIVCRKGDVALIVDVTIRYESNKESLEAARREKLKKYQPLVATIIQEYRPTITTVEVLGFPVGARGKWPRSNNAVLKTLGLSKKRRTTFAKCVSRRTILYSLNMLTKFMNVTPRE